MDQCFEEAVMGIDSTEQEIEKRQPVSGGAASLDNSHASGGFDCNICLEFVQDPVVTFCGHLYCWPCIYKWIHSQNISPEDPQHQPQCPVCKAAVSTDTLVPLYGRGQTAKSSGPVIPHRPVGPCGVHTVITAATTSGSDPNSQFQNRGNQYHEPSSYGSPLSDYPSSPALGLAGTTTFHPMIGMFGDMICARIFGNSQTTLYTYPNTYSVVATSSARVRRHVRQVDRSLSRVSFFLCCCVILCLLLF